MRECVHACVRVHFASMILPDSITSAPGLVCARACGKSACMSVRCTRARVGAHGCTSVQVGMWEYGFVGG